MAGGAGRLEQEARGARTGMKVLDTRRSRILIGAGVLWAHKSKPKPVVLSAPDKGPFVPLSLTTSGQNEPVIAPAPAPAAIPGRTKTKRGRR